MFVIYIEVPFKTGLLYIYRGALYDMFVIYIEVPFKTGLLYIYRGAL